MSFQMAFIVGVGYPVEGSLSTILHEVMHCRMRDFLPDRDRDAEDFIQQHFPVATPAAAGKAAAFWRFLHQELIPLDDEANYAREHDRLPVRLHFVMEESDSEVATLERFLDTLASRAYAGLKVSHQVLNCTHCAIVPPAFQAGLVAVFS